jgi:hypothetical protein
MRKGASLVSSNVVAVATKKSESAFTAGADEKIEISLADGFKVHRQMIICETGENCVSTAAKCGYDILPSVF